MRATDIIKNAAAVSFFWYIFTIYLKKGWSLKIILLLVICVGLHSQSIMLIPVFFYNKCQYKLLLIITSIIIILSPFINILSVILSIIPSSSWTDLLIERASGYAESSGEGTTKRYIFIGLLTYAIAIFLNYKEISDNKNKISNILLIYVLIMFLNYNNSTAFLRLANLISFIATIEFIGLYSKKSIRQLSYVYLGIYLILNLQMTLGRTISGGYCSSYMDNSIGKLFFSNVYDYLIFKAYP